MKKSIVFIAIFIFTKLISEFGCYTFANDSLIIDQSITDGFAITLKH